MSVLSVHEEVSLVGSVLGKDHLRDTRHEFLSVLVLLSVP